MVREDSLITVGQVKVFWQTAHRTAVFNSSVRGKKSEKSTQADQSLATSLPAFAYTLSNLCNVELSKRQDFAFYRQTCCSVS